MQIVSYGDNLHVMSKPVFWEKKIKKISSLLLEKKLQNFSNNASGSTIKQNLSNLLELASDGNCSLLFEEIN